ncbi:tyrosine recombinase XerC [Balneolales bacterium ANBcel1]|nr:tyrosine recombinase XerC [Balneolales bacterium ANBcel1]
MSGYKLLDRFIRFMEVERNASQNTRQAYQRDLRQFLDFCCEQWKTDPEAIDYRRIDRLIIRLWLGSLMQEKYAKTTLARKTASVRSFLKYCYKRGMIHHNPAQLLMVPKKDRKLPKSIRPEQIELMMELVDTETAGGKRDLAFLELLYSSGMRLSELTTLNMPDIDVNNNRVKVQGKGSKQRVIPFGNTAREALVRYLECRSELIGKKSVEDDRNALFLTDTGKRIYPRLIQRKVRGYLSRVSEVTCKSPHAIRHSFATHLLDRGAGIRVIKELLGHADLSATQIYTGTSIEHLRKSYQSAHPRADTRDEN